MLPCVSVAQARTKCGSIGAGLRHFSRKKPYKVALVCSCDSCDMLTCISTGQARTKSAPP